MKRHLIPILLVFIGLASLSFTTTSGIKLRLKPQKDKTYTINSKTFQTSTITYQGQTMTTSQTVEGRQTFFAKETSATSTVFETQIEAIKLTSNIMGIDLVYDSENPENTSKYLTEQAKELDRSINDTTTLTYNELGKIISEGAENANQLGNVLIEFSEKEQKEGSQWSNEKTQIVNEVAINVTMTYTVNSISKEKVELSFTGEINSNTNNVSGTYIGTASIDPQTGITKRSTMKSNLSMDFVEEGTNIHMNITGTTIIEVK